MTARETFDVPRAPYRLRVAGAFAGRRDVAFGSPVAAATMSDLTIATTDL